MWKLVGLLLAAVVALSVIGLVVRALRWLLIVALVLLAVNAVLGAIAGSGGDRRR
jgi:hypothetical protein